MTGAEGALQSLSADEIDAVGVLWKRQGRQFVTSFNGTSMLPAIAPGQLVTVTCGVEPVVGDVAVFRYSDQVGVHRVVARSSTWLLTWGDNNPLPDDPVTPDRDYRCDSRRSAAPKSLRRKHVAVVSGFPEPADRSLDAPRQARLPCADRLEAGTAGICRARCCGLSFAEHCQARGRECPASMTSALVRSASARASTMLPGFIRRDSISCC